MSTNFSDIIKLAIFFYLPTLLLLMDIALSAAWNRMYFTSGLLLFMCRIPVSRAHPSIPPSSQVEAQFQSNWSSSLSFKEIAPNTYGFREKFFESRLRRNPPLMHGVLFFDFANSQVVVRGYANWSILCFSLLWLGDVTLRGLTQFPASASIAFPFLAVFTLILGMLYFSQYMRFTEVASFAAQAWIRKDMRNRDEAPEEFVKSYFDAINRREYDSGWSMLSREFQENCPYHEFTSFWDTVDKVEILSTEIRLQNTAQVLVYVGTQYYYKNGAVTTGYTTYCLSKDEHSWFFNPN